MHIILHLPFSFITDSRLYLFHYLILQFFMDTRGGQIGLALVLLTLLWHGAAAQSGCTSVLIGLSPCLNYITGNSSTPSSSCCSQLANVAQSQPNCLCAAVNNGGAGLGIAINKTLALGLPEECNVKTPPVSQCNGKAKPNI